MATNYREQVQARLRATLESLVTDWPDLDNEGKAALRSRFADATPEALQGYLADTGGWETIRDLGETYRDKLAARVTTAYRWAREQPDVGANTEPCQPLAGRANVLVARDIGTKWAPGFRPRQVAEVPPGSWPEVTLYSLTGKETETGEQTLPPWIQHLAAVARKVNGEVPILGPWRAILWALESSEWEILSIGLVWSERHPGQREGDWLRLLVGRWVNSQVETIKAELAKEREQEERRRNSRSLVIRPTSKDTRGDRYVALDRALEEGAAWFGGPLVVNAERYTETPEVARYRPRGFDVVPESILKRRKNALLPGMEPHQPVNEFLALTATKAAGLDKTLPRLTAKLVPVMFATCRGDTLVSGTLEELTRLLNPKATRIQKRDLETAAGSLVAAAGLRMIERLENGRFKPYNLFDVDYEFSTARDAKVGWTLNPWFAARMTKGGTGYFLVNIDRLLTLDTQQPGTIAMYLNLAGWWHTRGRQRGTFHADRCEPRLLLDLAKEVNALSPTAAEYANTRGEAARWSTSACLTRIRDDLDSLKEAGLIGSLEITGRGTKARAIILPDDGYVEACNRAHNQTPKRPKK